VGEAGGFSAAADVQLRKDPRDVHTGSLLCHEQLSADLSVVSTLGEELEHLALSWGEPERPSDRQKLTSTHVQAPPKYGGAALKTDSGADAPVRRYGSSGARFAAGGPLRDATLLPRQPSSSFSYLAPASPPVALAVDAIRSYS
jgi:hypothetical protein